MSRLNGHTSDMRTALAFRLGPADHLGRRKIEAVFDGNVIHSDRFDPLSAWHRAKFVEGLIDRCEPLAAATLDNVTDEHDARWVSDTLLAAAEDDGPEIAFPMLTAAELDGGEYSIDYLVQGLLAAGQPCVLGGGFKTLKTTLAIDLAIALATGGCFLGRFRVSGRCRVAMFSGESGLASIQETSRRIALAAGYSLSEIEGLHYSDALPQLASVKHLQAVERFISEQAIDVVILDPLYLSLATGGGEASLYAMGELLRPLTELSATTKVTPILVHHFKRTRQNPYAMPELSDLAFSGIAEFARQWLLLGRRDEYTPGSGEHRLWLSAGGSAGHSGAWAVDVAEGTYGPDVPRSWAVTVASADEAVSEAASRQEAAREQRKLDRAAEKRNQDKQAIIAAITKLPGRVGTISDIKNRCGKNSQAFQIAFAELLNEGSVVLAEPVLKGNNRPYEAYKLGGSTIE